MVRLCVLMPCFNEEDLIGDAIREVQTQVLDRCGDCRLIVLDGDSRDRTHAIIREIAEKDARVELRVLAGVKHGPALVEGMEHSESEYLMLIDSDRQMPLDDTAALLERAVSENAAVIGVRRSRQDPIVRVVMSRVIELGIYALFGAYVRDGNTPYKIFSRKLWERSRNLVPPGVCAPSLMLAIVWAMRGERVVRVPVAHRPRRGGKAISYRSFVRALRWGMSDLVRLRAQARVGR